RLEEEECNSLTEVGIDKLYNILRVIDEKRRKLLVLADKGIRPGAKVRVLERRLHKLVLDVDGKKCVLDRKIASDICVQNLEDKDYAEKEEEAA
ncbi:MAG: ferrous iron transport protein A, partial [Candidatus Korarchaeota archaeon]|nr:ferrous iron transport protein A [Candidatus Korarchaeota archaeon]